MPRYFLLLILLSLAAAPSFAADKSSGGGDVVHGGGLVCFSIIPPRDREATCNRLCAARGAACVGLKTNGAMNPGVGCADADNPKTMGDYVAACRCCAVEHR